MFAEDTAIAWPVLIDSNRELYATFGLTRASTGRVWLSPRTLLFYARSLLAGRLPRRTTGDTRQLGGDVVVDAQGTVRYVYASAEPADRPPVYELLGALAAGPEEAYE